MGQRKPEVSFYLFLLCAMPWSPVLCHRDLRYLREAIPARSQALWRLMNSLAAFR